MGKLSYIEYTLSIVRCLKPFQILLFFAVVFFCVEKQSSSHTFVFVLGLKR